jgi:hypothetical protein
MSAIKAWFVATTVLCLTGFMVSASPALAVKGVETQLFFGSAIPEEKQPCNGILTRVTDELWESFVAFYVADAFPQGFTVVEATGLWQDQATSKPVSENSRVLILVAAQPDEQKIQGLIKFYLKLFCQDAVLRIDNEINFDFVSEQ